jgi:hypothetical protein
MKHSDNILPYMLASMHPMIHLSLLTASMVLRSYDNDGFFEIPNEKTCTAKAGSKAMDFIDGEKIWLMGYIQLAHLLAIVFHYAGESISQNKEGSSMVGQVFLLLKIFVYYSAHFTVQTGIIFDECRENIVDKSQVMAWLSYEVVAFYLNILAMCVFLLLSSCKKFISIRERIGFSSQLRKTTDFLTYCKEDIHWFCMWFTQIMLCILALTMKVKSHEDLKWSVGLLFTRHILELVVLRQVYFNSKFEIKSYIKLIMAIIFVLNCFMIKLFFDLEDDHSTWWAPIMLHDIILHFYVFFQIAMESSQWEKLKAEYAAQGGDQDALLADAKDKGGINSSGPDSGN